MRLKIEKLPSGSYRVRKQYKGHRYTIVFPYKPTQKEVIARISELLENAGTENYTMEYYILKYIDSKRNVLSPSTINTYEHFLNVISRDFLKIRLGELTQFDVQEEINRYSENHSPKSVRSLHGFISAVIALFRPQMILRTTLPQKIQKERYLPSQADIDTILNAIKGSEDSIAFQLGVLGLRRSEICALEMSDLKGNELHIHADMVYYKKWIKKESPKSDASNRIVYLPQALVEEIKEKGYFFKYSPNKLNEHLQKLQEQLGIPRFRFHDLRHFFASYASTVMTESEVMALGGWESDHVFKKVYREAFEENKKKAAEELNKRLFS